MPYFRATVVDKAGKKHTREMFAGCETGVRQHLLVEFGEVNKLYGKPTGNKTSIIVRDIKEIDPPK